GLATIDVDGVAKCLERVETDAERQHHAEEGFPLKMAEAKGADDFVIGFDAEVEIFEKAERHQIAHDRDSDGAVLEWRARFAPDKYAHGLMPNAPHLPGVVRDGKADEPIDERRAKHQQRETRLGPAVENVAGKDQPKISPALRRAPERVITEQRTRQKIVNKDVRTKDHG